MCERVLTDGDFAVSVVQVLSSGLPTGIDPMVQEHRLVMDRGRTAVATEADTQGSKVMLRATLTRRR